MCIYPLNQLVWQNLFINYSDMMIWISCFGLGPKRHPHKNGNWVMSMVWQQKLQRLDRHTNRQSGDLVSFCGVGNQHIYSTNFNKINKLKIVLLLMGEILYQLRWWTSHYLQGFIHPRWCRISEPWTVWTVSTSNQNQKLGGGFNNPFENISQIGLFPQVEAQNNKYLKPSCLACGQRS